MLDDLPEGQETMNSLSVEKKKFCNLGNCELASYEKDDVLPRTKKGRES